jgi:hypothetical protein
VSPYSLEEAWALTGRLSPRPEVRVATREANGEIVNRYPVLWSVDQPAPSTTWAILLTDSDHRFRYLCFDFDVSAGNAVRDAARMSYWLHELNIPHLVCISGSSGGRHIWVRLGEPADGDLVHDLAYLARDLLPSIDIKPLTNRAAGCVRPPYAPHRVAGYSAPQGDLRAITEQEALPEAIEQLMALLVDYGAELPAPTTALPHGVVLSADGRERIRGTKRHLSPRMDAVLHGSPGRDASHTLAVVAIACANARWAYADLAALVSTAPSLEHARTRRVGDQRVHRTPQQAEKVLTAAWKYAVRFVATNPLTSTADDPEYRGRMLTVGQTVERALERADALPGLWSTHNRRVGGSHSQRAVLDALCMYMLQSSQHVVEADIRRLSADTGYGRTTVHTALRALAGDGVGPAWIERVGIAEGVNAQRYRLHQRFSTAEDSQDRTQARMRASRDPYATTHSLIREIATRLELLAHDVFCSPHSLGRTAGLIFKTLPPEGTASLADLALRTGLDPDRLRRKVYELSAAGLVSRHQGAWRRHSPIARDFVARQLDVHGYLAGRLVSYNDERKVWAWWLAELSWMEKPQKRRRGRKPPRGAWYAEADRPEHAEYPRGPTRRGDHRRALALVRAGYLDRGFALVA